MVEKEEFSIISRDGTQLAGYEYLVDTPKALICMIHGLGEHAGRYEHVAQFFCNQQVAFYVIDMRGHGDSEGKRGHAASHEALLEDVEELMMYARSEFNDLPMFLYGHSMGGGVVANYCLLRNTGELSGAILSSPWLSLVDTPPAWKITLANKVAKVWPSFTQSNELSQHMLTNDPAVNEAYMQDPKVFGKISVKLFSEAQTQGQWAIENTDRLKLPLFVFHGEDDPITSPTASKEFSEQRPELITYTTYPDTKHEPHNDLKKEEVLENVMRWMDGMMR
ncbi:alpha/beta hydrolase [Reichenbachiella agariperforans]|uniref:alpha/beta hydrolase n=1 Tax=Reichenbachiella agariperforans TaxID=156994 RepID=UPI001C087319|nr:alpha/beta hydrolase [Reichenbachiella agariperforans]MBU2914676.1 lysophospholipase [Reichenbachiella agariperforans]